MAWNDHEVGAFLHPGTPNQVTFTSSVSCFYPSWNQLAAGLVFGLCFLLNLVNIWQTGQFCLVIQIPEYQPAPVGPVPPQWGQHSVVGKPSRLC